MTKLQDFEIALRGQHDVVAVEKKQADNQQIIDWSNIDPVKAVLLFFAVFGVGPVLNSCGNHAGNQEVYRTRAQDQMAQAAPVQVAPVLPSPAPAPPVYSEPETPKQTTSDFNCRHGMEGKQMVTTCFSKEQPFAVVTWMEGARQPHLLVKDGTWRFKCREGRRCPVKTPGVFEGTIELRRDKQGQFGMLICRDKQKPWQVASAATGFTQQESGDQWVD